MILTAGIIAIALTGLAHPVYDLEEGQEQIESLKSNCSAAMKYSPEELFEMVPIGSGIVFCDCPNCGAGSENFLDVMWDESLGDQVRCLHCETVLPNEEFPNNREKTILSPGGIQQVYRWHEDQAGKQYHFQGRAWYDRGVWTRTMARIMANVYALSGDNEYGDRAAAILGRWAQLYKEYPIRYDHPNHDVRFYPADQKWPYDGVEQFTARPSRIYHWVYGDIPEDLILAYDMLAGGESLERMASLVGPEIRERIENDLIRLSYEFFAAQPPHYDNMMPATWRDMILAGRVLGDPRMVEGGIEGARKLIRTQFTFDGWWMEGAPSYHWQVVDWMSDLLDSATGTAQSDLPSEVTNLLAGMASTLSNARERALEGVLPNGRMIPVNDTWWHNKHEPLESTTSKLWSGWGHALLGAGKEDTQFQLHLNWSGNYGHSHLDNGSIVLYAVGREMLSDIGYTYTRYRNWVTNSASHNLVVIDSKSQDYGTPEKPSTGNLLFYDDTHPNVKVIDLDASPAYSSAEVYRRRLVHVHVGEGSDYVVDLFDVQGGQTHDWFLHGSADEEGDFESSLEFSRPVDSLVPDWGGQEPLTRESGIDMTGETTHPYRCLWEIRSSTSVGSWISNWDYGKSGLRAHLFPPSGAQLYTFASPAIRPVGKDDEDIDRFLRRGLLQRSEGGESRFAALYEPYDQDGFWIEGVEYQDNQFVIRHIEGTDTISFADNRVRVESAGGWEYDSGLPITGEILAVERGENFAFVVDQPLPSINFVRVDLGDNQTSDDARARSIVYPVASIEQNRLMLKDDPGFEFDGKSNLAQFLYFPPVEFQGGITYTAHVAPVDD